MNFSELTKEQKQYAVLAVMSVITVFFVVQNLVVTPMKERAAAAEKTIAELESKVRTGEALLRRDRINQEEMREMSADILRISREHLPDRESQLSWAQRVLNQIIKDQLKLDGEAEKVHPGQRVASLRGSYSEVKELTPMWGVFAVDVNLRVGYDDVQRFLRALHEAHPYASVGRMTMRANPAHPEKHLVELVIEWPVFRFREDLRHVETFAGEES